MRLSDCMSEATTMFATHTDGPPDTILTGIVPVDRAIGGLLPGSTMVVGARHKTGKSTVALQAALEAERARPGQPHAIISLEDPASLWGLRAISLLTGINYLRLMRKDGLSAAERAAIREASGHLARLEILEGLGKSPAALADLVTQAHEAGCRLVALDYVQRVGRGDEPRHSIIQAMRALQARATEHRMALVLYSQVTPRYNHQGQEIAEPQPDWVRECRDIAIEARVVVMYWVADGVVHGKLAVSTYGGAGTRWRMRRAPSGMLEYVDEQDPFAE